MYPGPHGARRFGGTMTTPAAHRSCWPSVFQRIVWPSEFGDYCGYAPMVIGIIPECRSA
jgi:hypothetical protein